MSMVALENDNINCMSAAHRPLAEIDKDIENAENFLDQFFTLSGHCYIGSECYRWISRELGVLTREKHHAMALIAAEGLALSNQLRGVDDVLRLIVNHVRVDAATATAAVCVLECLHRRKPRKIKNKM